MSRKLIFICATIATTVLFGIASRADAPRVDLANENTILRREVARLQAEVVDLRMQLKAAETAEAMAKVDAKIDNGKAGSGLRLRFTPSTTQPTLILPSQRPLPPGTVEQWFNGAPVYVIPLEAK